MFKIANATEYGDKILMDTYNVNRIDVYTQWDDANGDHHRSIYKRRISGTFTMKFASTVEYNAFLLDLEGHKSNGGFVPVRLFVNNLDEEQTGNFYIDFKPILSRNNNYTKGFLEFAVTIEER